MRACPSTVSANPWESPTTAASLMLAIALILIAHDSEPVIGRALFLITGRWHLADLLGHIIAAAALAASTGSRCFEYDPICGSQFVSKPP